MINEFNKIIQNKKVISIIFAVLTFNSLCLQKIIESYNPISWILFFALIILYNKIEFYNKIFSKSSIIYSLIFTFFLTFGKIVYTNLYNTQVNVQQQFFSISTLAIYIGTFILIYSILINILPKLYRYKMKYNKVLLSPKKNFVISFITMLIGWLPYFLSLYPGALSNDSIATIDMIMNNFTTMSNHHPIIHTIFVAVPFKVGMNIFDNINSAVACSTIVQMITMASIFSYLIYYLSKRKVNNLILILCLLYFAFLPVHGYYSVTMWKDIMFAGFILLLIIQLINICDKNEKIKLKDLISFIIISILTIFFRNNAIYMYFILIIAMLIIIHKDYKVLLVSFAIILSIYYLVTGPIFNCLNISKSASAEYIGIPLQQVARMAYKDVGFTQKEKEILNELMKIDNMKKYYTPFSVDGIKFNDNYNSAVFDKNKLKYLKLWLQLVIKHPDVALESYAVSTLGYWYPGIDYWVVHDNVVENKFGIYQDSKVPAQVSNFIDKIEKRSIPILNMTWSTSLSFWIISLFCYIGIHKKRIKYLIPYIPIFGIWLTMMLASPVFGEFRYIYSSYTCLPLLIILPYLSNKQISK